jgi:hypothetical protein
LSQNEKKQVSNVGARFRRAEAAHGRAEEYRRIAAEHANAAGTEADPALREHHRRLSEAYLALAKEEDWLAGKINPDA